jgi:hypothetical protein
MFAIHNLYEKMRRYESNTKKKDPFFTETALPSAIWQFSFQFLLVSPVFWVPETWKPGKGIY